MRLQLKALLTVAAVATAFCHAQDSTIRTTVPLVVAPAAVTDRQGKPIYGLTAEDFKLLDEGKPRKVQVAQIDDGTLPPIAAVIAVETTDIALSALGKIRKVGSLVGNAVAGQDGETAVLTFDNEVKTALDFNTDEGQVRRAFENLRPSREEGGRMIDAVSMALDMLDKRAGPRRNLIVVIGESRDRGSRMKLDDLVAKAGRSATTIYCLTYSAYLTPFTTRASEYEPPAGGGIVKAITETARNAKANTSERLTAATGGQHFGFATKNKLEKDLVRLGGDIHSRYVLTFRPESDAAAPYHHLSLRLKSRGDAIIHVRNGYWLSE